MSDVLNASKKTLCFRRENRHLIVLGIIFICLLALAGVETSLGLFSTATTKSINRSETVNFTGIAINSNLSGIANQDQFVLLLHFSLYPKGDYVDTLDPLNRLLSKDVSISIDSNIQSFQEGDVMVSQDLTLPIQNGLPRSYPFDSYSSSFYIQCFSQTINSVNATNGKEGIPLSLSMGNSLQDWTVDFDITSISDNYSLLQVKLEVTRAPMQKFFSLFIVILMWVISLAIFLMAWSHFYFKRPVDAPTIGVATSMLFALPAVRNMQPGAPVIGCTSDVVGFFWNMAFIAAASLMLLYKFSLQSQNSYRPIADDHIKIPTREDRSVLHTLENLALPSLTSLVMQKKDNNDIEMTRLMTSEDY